MPNPLRRVSHIEQQILARRLDWLFGVVLVSSLNDGVDRINSIGESIQYRT